MKNRLFYMSVVVVLGLQIQTIPLAAQPPGAGLWHDGLPAGSLGKVATVLTNAINSGIAMDARWYRWRKVVGPMSVRGHEMSGANEALVWVEGDISHAWYGIDITLDSAGRSSGWASPVFTLAWSPPPNHPVRLRRHDAPIDTGAIRRYVAGLARNDLFSGAVLVAQNHHILLSVTAGYANRALGIPNRESTRFSLGSVGKLFTAVAAAELVEQRKVSFNDPIAKFLPDYSSANAQTATLGFLLSHSAGLKESETDWIATREVFNLRDLVASTASSNVEFPAGSSTRYSNEGFLVAGRIVEVASGEDYYEYVKRHIFAPLAMRHTDFSPIDSVESGRAVPYSNLRIDHDSGQRFVPGPRRDATYLQGFRGTPAGGSYSTIGDLFKFVDGLRRHQILDSAMVEQMMQPHSRSPFGAFGYGFEIDEQPMLRVGKGGNAQGVSAQLDIYPRDDIVIIILSNYDSSAQVAAVGIRALLGL